MAHAERALPGEHDEPAGTLLAVGVVAIVVAFLLGGALAEPNRSAFVSVAVEDTIVFVAAGLVARSLARLAAVGGGFDWRRNPVWVGLLATLVGAILLVAVPGSFAVGPLVVLIVAALPVPLLVIGLLTGVDRRAVRFILGFSAVAAIVLLAIRAFGSSGGPLPPIAGPGVDPTMPPDQPWMTVAAWLVGLVVVALAVALLAALWMYQARSRADDDVDEDRAIDHGAEPPGGAGRRRWRRRPGGRAFGAPTDAVSAYRATIAELSRVEPFRRRDGETPAEHARRVRGAVAAAAPAPAEGGFGAALDLLAADYELARFGGRSLTQAEDRRAIGRWRRVRAALRRRPVPGWRAATGNREGPS
jgi:multisubunit Na+/H+ antiporter MnhC subunit